VVITNYIKLLAFVYILLIINSLVKTSLANLFKINIDEVRIGIPPTLFRFYFRNIRIIFCLIPLGASIQFLPFRTVNTHLANQIKFILMELSGLFSYLIISIVILGVDKVNELLKLLINGFYSSIVGSNVVIPLGKLGNIGILGFISLFFFLVELIPYEGFACGRVFKIIIVEIFNQELIFKVIQYVTIGLSIVIVLLMLFKN
jgi:hypothetical protein